MSFQIVCYLNLINRGGGWDEEMDEWMDGSIREWINGLMDRSMDKWIDGQING